MSCVYLNGKFVKQELASIPITDRGFLFGDGVFTTIKVEEGSIYHLEHHLKRIAQHCRALNITPPKIKDADLYTLVQRNNAGRGVWRMKIIVTGGEIPDLALPTRNYGTVLITIKEVLELPTSPAKLVIYPDSIVLPHSSLKSLSYLQRLQVKQYAVDHGADDALVLSPKGFILESAFSNIFWMKDNDLFTPKTSLPLLRGITLNNHIEAVKKQGGQTYEGEYKVSDIPTDANIYLCNTITEKRAVQSIQGR